MAFADSEQGADPPKKRLLPFKRTASRKADAPTQSDRSKPDQEDNIDFFRLSKDIPIVTEEPEELSPKKTTKSTEPPERKRRKLSSDTEDGDAWKKRSIGSDNTPKKGKGKAKSFILDDSDYDDLVMDVKGKGKEITRSAKTSTPKKPDTQPSKTKFMYDEDSDDFYSPPKRRPAESPAHTRTTRSGNKYASESDTDEPGLRETKPRIKDLDEDKSWKPDTKKAISLLDSDDDLEVVETKPKIVDDDSDLELKEIAGPDPANKWMRKAEELKSQKGDVTIKFTVSSELENARPIVVKRKMGQVLGLILETWISLQIHKYGVNIPDDVAAALFMTWKGKKVYKSTTPISLGIQVDEYGHLICDDNDGYHDGGVLLEVWSEEEYARYQKEKERERQLRLGLLEEQAEVSDDDRPPTPQPEKKKGIKVVLKAKELEPVKLAIYEDTTVARLVDAFRLKRDLGEGQSVAIYFDGEKLDEESLVVDADIDPDETNQFEVHVR